MNFKKGSISVDNYLLNLLNSSSIIKKNRRLFFIWAVDKEWTPCLLPEKDILCRALMQLNQYQTNTENQPCGKI